jgi:hypothetical protein
MLGNIFYTLILECDQSVPCVPANIGCESSIKLTPECLIKIHQLLVPELTKFPPNSKLGGNLVDRENRANPNVGLNHEVIRGV